MIKKLLLLLLLNATLFAGDLISLLPYKSNEFSPALKQTFKLTYTLSEDANVTWEIYSPDNNLIRTIHGVDSKKGEHTMTWDGKDTQGIVVPDEAYNIVLIAKNKKTLQTIDQRFSGGEILKNLNTEIDKTGNISYTLSRPARVLVRAGIENSDMLRVISNWVPRNSGKVRQHWNMKDKDGIVDISRLAFGISVSAFALPEYSIITTNNKQIDYFTYFKQKKFNCNTLSQEEQILRSKNKAISKHFYTCRIKDRAPRITLTLPKAKKNDQNISILENGKRTLVKVTMHPEDEAILEKAKYEVSFFVDHQFSSEEELGYMPISWSFNPNALEKGEHILTVNVSSFSGQVGVKSYKFKVK